MYNEWLRACRVLNARQLHSELYCDNYCISVRQVWLVCGRNQSKYEASHCAEVIFRAIAAILKYLLHIIDAQHL